MVNIIKGSGFDSLYIKLSDAAISHSAELHPDMIVDLAENGEVVGIDIQNATALARELGGQYPSKSVAVAPAQAMNFMGDYGADLSCLHGSAGRLVYMTESSPGTVAVP